MTDTQWRTWDQIEDEARKAGRLDEARVAAHQEHMRAEQRAYRLAEIRKHQGLTQNQIAATMHVSQRRVSAVERGDLSRTELGTVESYVRALGGHVEIVADFGDERIVIGLPGSLWLPPGRRAEDRGAHRRPGLVKPAPLHALPDDVQLGPRVGLA
jgi:transcriptional regulator with XRE-family HTH domain